MKKINEDIRKNTFEHIYLLYGKESYNRLSFTSKLCSAIIPDSDTMNFTRFTGDKVTEGEIIDLAETLPFFAEKRLILVKDTGLFKRASEQLADYIGNLPESTVIIFSEAEVDKRGRLYKAVSKAAYVCEFTEQKEDTLRIWGAAILKRNGLRITADNMSYIITCTGTDMTTIAAELDKIVNYAQGAHPGMDVVTRDDIDAVISVKVEDRIFDMISALVRHDRKRAYALYADLVALQRQPMATIVLISREYDRMLKVLELSQGGDSEPVIAEKLALKPFVVRKTLGNARRYSLRELRDHVAFAVSMDEAVKTGAMKDQTALEMMLARFSL